MRRGNARTGGRQAGFTIVELVWVCATLSILAAAAFPLIRDTRRQQKEIQLRYALAKLRHAIDEYKRFCDAGSSASPSSGPSATPPISRPCSSSCRSSASSRTPRSDSCAASRSTR